MDATPSSADPRSLPFKQRVYRALEDPFHATAAGRLFSVVLFLFIVINLVLVFLDVDASSSAAFQAGASVFEIASIILFGVEYALRVWTADLLHTQVGPARARMRYVLSPMGLVDLFAFLPSLMPFFFPLDARIIKSIRLIRLARLFKVTRYMEGVASIGRVFRERANQILSACMVLVLLIIVAAVLVYEAEHSVQPQAFDSVWTALYWAMTTITTTGYGDITPVTALGRGLTFIIMMLAIGIVAIPAGILSAGFVEETRRLRERPHRTMEGRGVRFASGSSDAAEASEDAAVAGAGISADLRQSGGSPETSEPTGKRFCPYCGARLSYAQDPDARFCDACGKDLR